MGRPGGAGLILTSYWAKPIPTPNYDWEAWVDGREECEVGRGRTEADDLADLQRQLMDG